MGRLIARAGDRVKCVDCGEVAFVFSQDVYEDDQMRCSQVLDPGGAKIPAGLTIACANCAKSPGRGYRAFLRQFSLPLADGRGEYYTVQEYLDILRIRVRGRNLPFLGRFAVKSSGIYGYRVKKSPDARYGEVNSYHQIPLFFAVVRSSLSRGEEVAMPTLDIGKIAACELLLAGKQEFNRGFDGGDIFYLESVDVPLSDVNRILCSVRSARELSAFCDYENLLAVSDGDNPKVSFSKRYLYSIIGGKQ